MLALNMSDERLSMRFLILLCWLVSATPLWAACGGRDLIMDMDPDARAALQMRAADAPYANGILWRATRGEHVLHLIGTMHFYDARHQATFDQAKPWIDAAETVLLELGEGDEARLQAKIAADPGLAFITEGPTLPDLLEADDWERLSDAFSARGVPAFLGAKMQPWMALMTLSLTKCVVESVAGGQDGLDKMIIDYASSIGKPAEALEPFDLALSLFDEYGQDEMLQFLKLFLRMEAYDPDDQHHTLVEAYFREEVRLIWDFAVDQSLAEPQGMSTDQILAEYARLEEALVNTRNRSWMAPIRAALENGPVVVAAGALHMPGEQGLLRMLEEDGFSVERISRR